jgi:epoxyqueuosine reductase
VSPRNALSAELLLPRLRAWAAEAGFADVGVGTLELAADAAQPVVEPRGAAMRAVPGALRPGTVTVVSARMDCQPPAADAWAVLQDGRRAYIARYALGRDYHRLLRRRLKRLAERMRAELRPFGYRVLADSAPALEKALARNARLGWIGKNTLLLNRRAGSSFLLGEIYCDLPVRIGAAAPPRNHCGTCTACIDVCPTRAIVAPYRLDARRCISYLTIENRGPIPEEFRRAIGNRIFGCDDCQLACPWNRYARLATEPDFAPRHGLDSARLVDLFAWTEEEWLARTEGMALRRATYPGWLRNLAVALGNAPSSAEVVRALQLRAAHPDAMVREHVLWALGAHGQHPAPPATSGRGSA